MDVLLLQIMSLLTKCAPSLLLHLKITCSSFPSESGSQAHIDYSENIC
jgi:hypothetical protein